MYDIICFAGLLLIGKLPGKGLYFFKGKLYLSVKNQVQMTTRTEEDLLGQMEIDSRQY
jgi:hypothetical protein